jgi:regulatory protein
VSKKKTDSLTDTLFPYSYTVLSAVYNRAGDSVKLALSGGESLVLPAEKYALLSLREGSTLARERLLELKKIEVFHSAKKKAIRLLEHRAYTGAQITLKLTAAKYPKEIIPEVVRELRDHGCLDDLKYAEEWVAVQLKRKPQGRGLLYAGLVRRGIDRRDAERIIGSQYPPELEKEQCELFMKKAAGRRGWEAAALLPVLARRGFGAALIRRVYKELKAIQ